MNRIKANCNIKKNVNIPIELYKSLRGEYFVGYGDNLSFGKGTAAWARLYNPPDSGVNLHVNVWTVASISDSPFRAQIWFNSDTSITWENSPLVTPSDTALRPPPDPKVKLQLASNVNGDPAGGIKAFVRRGQPGTTMAETEDGKFVFPPGGSFLITLSNPEAPEASAFGRVAFGWWEEEINRICVN